MKLQNELKGLVEKFNKIDKASLSTYETKLKASGEYADFATRLAWDCLYTVMSSRQICDWYDKYNCNDEHVTTLAKKALEGIYKV